MRADLISLFERPQPEVMDAEARLLALDIERSWIVEAPAGSGKTGLLIQRYLCLLAEPKVTEPEQVLAITFTKAATHEIHERLLHQLQSAEEGADTHTEYDRTTRRMANAVLAHDLALGWRLLDDPTRLRVRTIDSVCAEIARSLPILSGGKGSLTPIEDASSLYEEAARRTWLHLGGADSLLDDALKSLLLHRDGDLRVCTALVAEMLAGREQWSSLVPLRAEDLTSEALDSNLRKQLDGALAEVVCAGLSRLVQAFPEELLLRLSTTATSLSDRPGYQTQPSPIAICRELRTSPTAAAEQLVYWRALAHLLVTPSTKTWRSSFRTNHVRFEVNSRDRAALQELLLEVQERPELLGLMNEMKGLPPATFPAEQWPITKALFRVLRQALTELQLVFIETAQCDFAEPALLARRALSHDRASQGLESTPGAELRHLLVDEMQDTSVPQYELLERLTKGWATEEKTVFLVGDPKQSIYLFRQARVDRFLETIRTGRLGELSVGSLQLTANFRSQAELISAFNNDFSRIFPRMTSHPEDVKYVHSVAIRKPTSKLGRQEGTAWHLSTLPGEPSAIREEVEAQHRRSARHIRQIIEMWHLRPLPAGRTLPWKIAVLVQSRSSLASVLLELKRNPSIPFRASKIETLNQRPEILDLLALSRALRHPADRPAWLAVLHAPWCGIGLADLHILTGKDDHHSQGRTLLDLISIHGTEVSPDATTRLERVWPVLDQAMRVAERVRFPERVERTWRSLGGHTFLQDAELKNAEAFLELLRAIDRERGRVEHSEVMRRLKRLHASPEDGVVELATIHGSKGLEWDIVLVPELERRSPLSASRLFEMEELLSGKVVLAPITAKGTDAAALNRWLRDLRSRREAAERKRLFYVACTRAREELHLFGSVHTQQDGTPKAATTSLLEAAWPAAKTHLVEAEVTEAPRQRSKDVLYSIAAHEQETLDEVDSPILERLPLDTVLALSSAHQDALSNSKKIKRSPEMRPQALGSLSSRCLHTTIHAFLEEAATRLAEGSSPGQLASELRTWKQRIRTLLRTGGLSPRSVEQHLHTVLKAVHTTVTDSTGQWLLGSAVYARNEYTLVTQDDQTREYRIDRLFRGGASPGLSGDTHLWIIDYKTSTFPGTVQDDAAVRQFLDEERTLHVPRFERYSRLIRDERLRLGLWFPLIGRLVWWPANEGEEELDPSENLSSLATPFANHPSL